MALQWTTGAARPAIAARTSAIGRLAGSLSYRRQEVLVFALLGGSVLGGFAIAAWHRRAPGPLDRLEAEPPRLTAFSRAPSPRARAAPAAAGRAAPPPLAGEVQSPPTPDLNRASAGELARLPGIGPRLAARIVARRSQLGGRFAAVDDLATVPGVGPRKAGLVAELVCVAHGPTAAPENAVVGEPPVAEPREGPEVPTDPTASEPP